MAKTVTKKIITTSSAQEDVLFPIGAAAAALVLTVLLNTTFGFIAGTACLFFAKTYTRKAQMIYGGIIFVLYFLKSLSKPLEVGSVANVSTSLFASLFAALFFAGGAFLTRKITKKS